MDTLFPHHASLSSSMESTRCSIQDQILEVTVVSGSRLKNMEWLSNQDPYVMVEYGGTKFRTKTCKGGGTNPAFRHQKFEFKLVEGLREITVIVYNSHTLSSHELIGYGKVDLQIVLCDGFHETNCLLTNVTRAAGEIKLILRYPNARKQETTYGSRQPEPAPPAAYPGPARHHIPSPYPPCPTFQPQYPPPHQQPPPGYPPQQFSNSPYPPTPSAPHVYYPPPPPPQFSNSPYPPTSSAPHVYYPPPPPPPPTPPPYANLNVYPPPPAPAAYHQSPYYNTPPSPYHGGYPPPPY